MSFRNAGPDDAVRIAQLLRSFYRESGTELTGIPYDHASTIRTVLDTITRGVCVIGKHSCAGAFVSPFPFNMDAIVADVLFWYFEDRREISIFDQLIEACKKAGATHINAAALAPKQTGKRFYQVRGMRFIEGHYLGPLNQIGLQTEHPGVKKPSTCLEA